MTAKDFQGKAGDLEKILWWRKVKLNIVIGVIAIVLIMMVVMLVVGND